MDLPTPVDQAELVRYLRHLEFWYRVPLYCFYALVTIVAFAMPGLLWKWKLIHQKQPEQQDRQDAP